MPGHLSEAFHICEDTCDEIGVSSALRCGKPLRFAVERAGTGQHFPRGSPAPCSFGEFLAQPAFRRGPETQTSFQEGLSAGPLQDLSYPKRAVVANMPGSKIEDFIVGPALVQTAPAPVDEVLDLWTVQGLDPNHQVQVIEKTDIGRIVHTHPGVHRLRDNHAHLQPEHMHLTRRVEIHRTIPIPVDAAPGLIHEEPDPTSGPLSNREALHHSPVPHARPLHHFRHEPTQQPDQVAPTEFPDPAESPDLSQLPQSEPVPPIFAAPGEEIAEQELQENDQKSVAFVGGVVALTAQLYLWTSVFVAIFKPPRRRLAELSNAPSVGSDRRGIAGTSGNFQGHQR